MEIKGAFDGVQTHTWQASMDFKTDTLSTVPRRPMTSLSTANQKQNKSSTDSAVLLSSVVQEVKVNLKVMYIFACS